MTPAEHLAFQYPRFFVAGGPWHQDEEARANALQRAEAYRPRCLSDELQNEAQAHYAAHILDARVRDLRAGAGQAGVVVPSGPVTSEREGDIAVTYADASGSDHATGPATPYARWQALHRLCGRGAILTRFG